MKHPIFLLMLLMTFFSTAKTFGQTAKENESAVLNHIAVYVTDLDKSAAFYETLLNLVRIEEPFKDGKHVWYTLGPAGMIHLIQGAKSNIPRDKNEHLCFSVPSVTAFIAKLDKEKIEYINWAGTAKAPTLRVDGVKQIYFQDPDGHWLEVNDDVRK